MDPRIIDPESGMVRVSRTMQILALKEWDTTFDEDDLNGVFRSTSPTLCGTTPPSPVDTLVELDFTPPAPMFPTVSTNEKSMESECDPHTFVYPHLFAIGDAADAFGAIKAGHTAYYQGEVAARNVIKLIKGNASTFDVPLQGLMFTPGAEKTKGDLEGDLELEEYVPGPPMIKVSLGLVLFHHISLVCLLIA